MTLAQAKSVAANLRTVLVKVSPAPGTLSERRAILRVLKQRGQVEYFKKLHDPSHFVSVVETSKLADNLIEGSPFQFDYVPRRGREGAAGSPPAEKKSFLVKITENGHYRHKTHIRETRTYGPWPEHEGFFRRDSVATAALRAACPADMAWRGLSDWASCGQLDDDSPLSTWLSSKTDYVQARQLRRLTAPNFDSLLEMYEEARERARKKAEKARERAQRTAARANPHPAAEPAPASSAAQQDA